MKLTSVTEYGTLFETGRPVCFVFVRNDEPAPYMGAQYLQDIEPHGRYMIHNPSPGELPRGWERGRVCFKNPLVLAFHEHDDFRYDTLSWKAALVRHFRAAGRPLTRKLLAAGYDGVVTTAGDNETREIVQLPWVR